MMSKLKLRREIDWQTEGVMELKDDALKLSEDTIEWLRSLLECDYASRGLRPIEVTVYYLGRRSKHSSSIVIEFDHSG